MSTGRWMDKEVVVHIHNGIWVRLKRWMKKWKSLSWVSLQPHELYSQWDSPGQNPGVGSLSFLQGIFPTQGWSPGLLHCRQNLYQLSYARSVSKAVLVCPFSCTVTESTLGEKLDIFLLIFKLVCTLVLC